MVMENCANCGVRIGNLETPMIWQGQVVCAGCRARLDTSRPPPPLPVATKKGNRILFLVLVVGAAGLLVTLGHINTHDAPANVDPVSAHSTGETSSLPETVSVAPAIDISAEELFAKYKTNEVAADEKFKGVRLHVRGTIGRISKDVWGNPFIEFAVPGTFFGVQCKFPPSAADDLVSLRPGDPCGVSGTCDGMFVGSVYLDCPAK